MGIWSSPSARFRSETWEKAQQLMDDKETFTSKIDGYNRGGRLWFSMG